MSYLLDIVTQRVKNNVNSRKEYIMSRLEVDVKSIQKLIRSRMNQAQKTLVNFESQAEKVVKELVNKGLKSQEEGRKQVEQLIRDVRSTVKTSPLLKNLKKSNTYSTALQAKEELEKRMAQAQEKVFEFLNIPTKNDLERLEKKVDQLSQKLRTTKKKKTKTETTLS